MARPDFLGRAFAWIERRREVTVATLIVGSAALRSVYAVAIMEPIGSGPDGPSYHEAAVAMVSDGFLASVPNVPYWPAGYPMLVALVYAAVGVIPQVVTVLQVALVAGATHIFYRWTEKEFGFAVGLTTLGLLSLSPAFGASQTVLMYEPVLAACLMVSIPLIASRSDGDGPSLLRLVGASTVLAIGSLIHPKLALTGVLVLVWWWWRWRRLAMVLVALVALALGPALLVARNYTVDGHAILSANLGTTLEIGVGQSLQCAPYDDLYERDRVLTRCGIEWTVENPQQAAQRAANRAVDYWRPFIGPLRAGTWFHAFDARRLVPRSILDTRTIQSLDAALSVAWMLLFVSCVGLGTWRAWQRNPTMALLVVLPVLAFFVVSVAIIGDARMRLPTTPLYTLLLACAAVRPSHAELTEPATQ